MKILVASDIFGATPELFALAKRFHPKPLVVSPYLKPEPEFENEEKTYVAYLSAGGLEAYVNKLSEAIAEYHPDALIGFSAGATAAWRALSASPLSLKSALLFYGSRIRDYLDIRPQIPVKLI